jgi:hypothetical protein
VTAARRVLIAAGALGMAYALAGALTDPAVKPFGVLIFLAGVLIAHDAILLPLVIAVGAVAGRWPARIATPVRVALVVSLSVTVVALPLVLGYGRAADNPSLLPRHYGAGLLEILAVVWVVTGVSVAVRARRHRRRTRSRA